MPSMNVNFNHIVGPIKKVNGVGQPPITGIEPKMFHYLKEANIPYSRLHDVGGTFGGGRFVDIPNIFPYFGADENDPESYDFAYTDWLIEELFNVDVEPVYRLGVTIEGFVGRYASPRIYPPKDYEKWARICEHVIRHYNEGWKNGYHFGITYWEIWNEPDNNCIPSGNAMWQGTAEDYYRLYEVTANHLKKCFPAIKIGGPASCGFMAVTSDSPSPREQYFLDFFDGFLKWISSPDHKSPFDFCSWHSYSTIEETMCHARYCREQLDKYGFRSVETHLNEWNPSPRIFGLMKHAVNVGGMICAMQNSPVDKAMFYDARIGISPYGSLFNPITHLPYADYDAFVMFGRLLALGQQAELTVSRKGVYAVAATNGQECGIMIVNTTGASMHIKLNIEGRDITSARCKVTSAYQRMEKANLIQTGLLELTEESMVYITL